MARNGTLIRGKNGQYIKETILNKIKYFCNLVITKIEKWLK